MSTQPLLQRTANKRIALPVRVEPKVFFANERTFLSWLHIAVYIGGLSIGMLTFGDKFSRIMACFYTAIAIGVMTYALYQFHFRARSISTRDSTTYGDRVGPFILTGVLTLCVLINFIISFAKN